MKEKKKNWEGSVYKKAENNNIPGWTKIRYSVMWRDHNRCFRCECRSKLTVHHIIPRSRGGNEDMDNLITLCSDCHDYVEIYELRTLVEIEGSYDGGIRNKEDKPDTEDTEETFTRPEWHKWVYGGQKRKTENIVESMTLVK